jgi:Dolichyl-phosphate-mannose-protein mannosyltransferase
VGTGIENASTGIGFNSRVREVHVFWIGTAAIAAGLAAALAWLLRTWPPHEDETLALFVGRGSLVDVVDTVITERGGAPLHFILAWTVVQFDGGLTALRALSLVFAAASVPLIALLGARLADRAVGLVAAALAAGSWMLLFNGVFGRMYSLFLFTSLLSFLALLAARDRGGALRFGLWGLALLLMLATHPYAVLVVAAQTLFVLVRRARVRETLATLAAVAVLGIPFWWGDIVLLDRFDVGIGGGGARLGSPQSVFDYLWRVAGDFSTGHEVWTIPVLVLAGAGALLLTRGTRPEGVLLAICVVAVPAIAFMLATLRSSVSPETRHLIFALPFFTILVAVALVAVARIRPPLTGVLAAGVVGLLIVGAVDWAERKTPLLFEGDPRGEAQARAAAGAWLASTGRPDDVLLGYEPVYLRAWERNRALSTHTLPRADPALFTAALNGVDEPLGRGVWLFDASDSTNAWQRQTIPFALPQPASAFEGRTWGPYLVIRTRQRLLTRARYIAAAKHVLGFGRTLQIGDATVNLQTIVQAERTF